MKAFELITHEIPPLRPSDPVGRALEWMEEFKVQHLPVVEERVFMGVVKDTHLVDKNDLDLEVGEFIGELDKTVAEGSQHVFEVISMFGARGLSIVPVVDENGLFLGTITEHDALAYMAQMTNITETGSVVILELNTHDYSLFEIARLVEGNDMKVLSMTTEVLDDSQRMQVILKIDTEDVSPVLQTFERYDYVVKSSHEGTEHHESNQERYDELMRYLNI